MKVIAKSFPFLIGKVLTETKPAPTKPGMDLFPFLIGKVLTTVFKPL